MPDASSSPAPAVFAVVVTYNRRALLEECLQALLVQTRRPDVTIVVDNASTDGTADFVRAEHPEVRLLALPDNQGGAGGFHEGLKAAHAAGAEWTWLMDDDTIAEPDALEQLLSAREDLGTLPAAALLSSKVVWTDGSLHPMNHPGFVNDRVDRFVASCAQGLLPLRAATFVSLLVHRAAIDEFGLPHKHFFLWSDDIEYTARITRRRAGYLVPSSVVVHKTKTAHTAVTSSGGRFYYHVRNSIYMLRSPQAWSAREKLSLLWFLVNTTQQYLRLNRFARGPAVVVLRGLRDGLRPVPATDATAQRASRKPSLRPGAARRRGGPGAVRPGR
ncbi:MAG: glycosyltransferase family 2 protein [Actinomycetota bacterium]|nr:glycosyltransferase family 2 protein [Actinomycetota bacterium]